MSNQRFSDFPIATSINAAQDYVPFAQWNGATYTDKRMSVSFLVGPTGAMGVSPTFTSLSATGLAYGATPTATLGGSAPNYTITFGIPAGPPGAGNVSGTGTNGQIVTWTGTSTVSGVANLTVAQGGTNATSASGTALDNITGFSGTGLLNRTGAGAYSFVATSTFAASSITVTGGSGLTGGGALTGNQTITVATNGITNAMLAQMATLTVKANITGSTANATDSTVTALLDAAFGATRGNVLYRGASAWAALGASTAGNVLTTQGTTADPTWTTPSSGGGAFPTVFSSKSANYTVVAADNGTQFALTGSFTLTLPSAATMGTGKGIFVSKTDGSGVWTITPVSGTIDGRSSINIYQERYALVSNGTNWVSIDRPKGWVPVANAALTSQTLASISIATPLNDTELSSAEIELSNYAVSTPSIANLTLTGATLTNGSFINNSGSALTTFTSSTPVGLSSSSTSQNLQTTIVVRATFCSIATILASQVSYTGFSYNTGTPTAAVITPSAGTISSITYAARLYRL